MLRCLTSCVIRSQSISCENVSRLIGSCETAVNTVPFDLEDVSEAQRRLKKGGGVSRVFAWSILRCPQCRRAAAVDEVQRSVDHKRGNRRAGTDLVKALRKRYCVSTRRGDATATPSADGDLPRGAAAAPLRLGESLRRTPTTPYTPSPRKRSTLEPHRSRDAPTARCRSSSSSRTRPTSSATR